MNWGGPEFVIAIIAISTGGWIINNWIRAKHGYALEDEWGGKTSHSSNHREAATQEVKQLRDEKRALSDQVDKMTDRLIVLEKIVTDRGYDVATQIEALRDQRVADHRGGGVRRETRDRESI